MEENKINNNRRPKIIKKYNNRKLYDTHESTYIILKDIAKMIRNKEDIRVIQNDSKNDITVDVLTEIIVKSERDSRVSAPIDILSRIIREAGGSYSVFLAGLGLFKAEDNRKDDNSNSCSDSSFSDDSKRSKSELSQTMEQKIASIAASSEESSEAIPRLPGSTL